MKKLALTVKTKNEWGEEEVRGSYRFEELDPEAELLGEKKKIIAWIPDGKINYEDLNIILSRYGGENDDEWFWELYYVGEEGPQEGVTNKFLAAKELEKKGVTVIYPTEVTEKRSTIETEIFISQDKDEVFIEIEGKIRGIQCVTFLIGNIKHEGKLDLSEDEDRELITLAVVDEIKKTYHEVPEVKAKFSVKKIELFNEDSDLLEVGIEEDLEKLRNRINGRLQWL